MLFIGILTSCEKQEYYEQNDVYDIPESTTISDCELMWHSVLVEWTATDGSGGSFASMISDYEYLGCGTCIYEINNNILNSDLFVGLIVYTDTVTNERKVFALKPSEKDIQQVWNEDAKAPVGVLEDLSKITIFTNNMNSPTDKRSMSMKLTILK
jgi:hypothetical protein